MPQLEYAILDAWDDQVPQALRKLEAKVRACQDNGWRPLGGVCLTYDPPQRGRLGLYTAVQAIVRETREVRDGS